jgi:hypothetical protein
MEEQSKQPVSLFTKISLGANIALFGITGVIYLIDVQKYNLIGYLLLAAGLTNVIWMLFSIPTKNLFFAILNFLFAGVSLFVGFHYQFIEAGTTMATIWFAIGLFYLINAFVILLRLKKTKDIENKIPSE